jgi:hypothetical protein
MKVAMALTMEGLLRALKGAAHGLAEDAEGGYFRREVEPGALVVRPIDGLRAHHEGGRLRMRATVAARHEGNGE